MNVFCTHALSEITIMFTSPNILYCTVQKTLTRLMTYFPMFKCFCVLMTALETYRKSPFQWQSFQRATPKSRIMSRSILYFGYTIIGPQIIRMFTWSVLLTIKAFQNFLYLITARSYTANAIICKRTFCMLIHMRILANPCVYTEETHDI